MNKLAPHLCRVLLRYWCFSCAVSRPFPALWGCLLLGGVVGDVTNGSHGHGLIPAPPSLWIGTLGSIKYCVDFHPYGTHILEAPDSCAPEVLQIGKTNPYPEVNWGHISGPFKIEGVQFSKLTTKWLWSWGLMSGLQLYLLIKYFVIKVTLASWMNWDMFPPILLLERHYIELKLFNP